MAKWSTAQINDLPDSSFAYIEPGGKKDSDGKTTPRSLRHLPYKDASGEVDHNHTSNALARLDQTQNVPASEKASIRTKLENALKDTNSAYDSSEVTTLSAAPINLDSAGEVPTRIPLFTTFDLPNSNRGHFTVDVDDLQQMKDHFDAHLGFPTEDATTGLPIDFEHRRATEKAAAWIKGLDLVRDPSDPTKATLFADPISWTPSGAQAIQDGDYKMVSPTGAFGKKNGKLSVYHHHTDLDNKLPNLLMGAGLVNEPFQSMMAPIRMGATERGSNLHSGYDNVIYVYDVQQKKEPSMNLAAIRTKEREELSVPELDFITEHQEELSASERTKFKLEASATDTSDELSAEDKQTLAAIKDGSKKVVDATSQTAEQERLGALESTVERYRKQEVTDLLDKHVKRGAIKQDAAKLDGFWGKQLLGAKTDAEMQGVKDALEALPTNEELSKKIGTGEDLAAGSTAREQLDALAKKKVADAAKNGETILYADALKAVYRENEELRAQDSNESKAKASVLTGAGV